MWLYCDVTTLFFILWYYNACDADLSKDLSIAILSTRYEVSQEIIIIIIVYMTVNNNMAVTPPGSLSLFRIIVGPALGMIDKDLIGLTIVSTIHNHNIKFLHISPICC